MENRGGMIPTRKICPSTRAVWQSQQQSSCSKAGGTGEGNYEFGRTKSLCSYSKGSLTNRIILLPLRRKACCGFLLPLKLHRPRPGLNPRTLRPMASTLTVAPPRTTVRDGDHGIGGCVHFRTPPIYFHVHTT
jgi:hypothetical protein